MSNISKMSQQLRMIIAFFCKSDENIIKMIQFDLQVQINDLLTQFLQSFKNIFLAKMSLIESICLNNNSLQNNPQFVLSRLSTKSFKLQWNRDPYSFTITQEIISNIQRFYLRIQQHLEYRLNPLVNLEDKLFNKQIEIFRKSLHQLINSLENQIGSSATVGEFLFQLSRSQKIFTSKLIELVSNKNNSLFKGGIDYESVEEIKKFVQSKICKEQFQCFREKIKMPLAIPLSRQKKFSLRGRQQQHSRVKFILRKKISSKIQPVRQSLPPRNVMMSMQQSNLQQNHWESKYMIPEDQTIDLQSYVAKQNELKLEKAYDIMNLQVCKVPFTQEEIFADLQGKNIKNRTCIQGFLHKYQKKERRHLRRERSQKQAKSIVKSSKLPSKGDDKNIFSIRSQNSQNLHMPNFKSNMQNLKKYEQFELPLIMSRNNRTTVQK